MHHDTPLITTIVAGLVLAFIFGMIANRFKMPPLVGYLFAGILAGPNTPGFVADQALGAELAELGVILLMFGVGLHFSLKDLMSVRALAIPGALVQIAFATLLGVGLAMLMGWGIGAGLIFGLALSVASTVVLLKALQDRRLIETERGRIAVGWLIVEDLAMVLALVLIPAIAGLNGGDSVVHDPFVSFVERVLRTDVGIWGVLALTLIKVAAFVGFMLIVGRRVIPWALHGTAHTGSRELFRLAVLAIALGVALGSSVLFGVSLALGAFFAGMILSESELSQRAAQETLPLRDAFAVLFFVSVGMLFDPMIIVTNPLPLLATVFIILIGKSVAAFGIVLLFKRPVATALTISASLAQIGEFSFILASMGVALAILPKEAQDLILAGSLISIVLNPVVFWAVDRAKPRLEARMQRRKAEQFEYDGVRVEPVDVVVAADGPAVGEVAPEPAAPPPQDDDDGVVEPTRQTDHTVLVGFGRVGRVVGQGLHASGAPLVVIEDSDHSIAAARAMGIEVIVGNAASSEVLQLANLGGAKCLLIAIPNGFEAGQVVEQGRRINPSIRIIARAHSDEEEAHLSHLGADTVIMGEREIGLGMLAWLKGEREDETAADAMVAAAAEPKLAPVENILAKAAAVPVTAEIIEVVAPAEITEPVSEAEVEAETETAIEAAEAEGLPVEAAPEGDVAAQSVEARDPVVIDAVESSPADTVIAMPPPASVEEELPPAADLESVETTPAVGEAPAEAEPKTPAPDDVILMPAPEPLPELEAPVTDAQPSEVAEVEEDPQASVEPATGAVTPADEAPAQDETTTPEDDEDKPAGAIPPVVPEPKI